MKPGDRVTVTFRKIKRAAVVVRVEPWRIQARLVLSGNVRWFFPENVEAEHA